MPLDDGLARTHLNHVIGCLQSPHGICKSMLPHRSVVTERKSYGLALSHTTGTTYSLEVVRCSRRNGVHQYNVDVTNIHAHLHCRGTMQHIDGRILLAKGFGVLSQKLLGLLGRVFSSNVSRQLFV